MKSAISIASLFVIAVAAFGRLALGFTPYYNSVSTTTTTSSRSSDTKLFFFGQPKDDGSPGDYLCKVSMGNIRYMLVHMTCHHIYYTI